jgi:hypothetical protein
MWVEHRPYQKHAGVKIKYLICKRRVIWSGVGGHPAREVLCPHSTAREGCSKVGGALQKSALLPVGKRPSRFFRLGRVFLHLWPSPSRWMHPKYVSVYNLLFICTARDARNSRWRSRNVAGRLAVFLFLLWCDRIRVPARFLIRSYAWHLLVLKRRECALEKSTCVTSGAARKVVSAVTAPFVTPVGFWLGLGRRRCLLIDGLVHLYGLKAGKLFSTWGEHWA